MGVCDVPVISGVCDAAGDAAGALVTAPFDWLAQGMGGAAEWMFESVWKVFDSTTYRRRHQRRVHEGLQHPVRRRGLRDARLLHAPGHRRHDPPRTRRAVQSRARAGEVDPRIVRRPRPARDRAGDHRPALHRHRQRRRHQHGARWATGSPCSPPGSAPSTSPRPAPARSSRSSSPASPSCGAMIVWISLLDPQGAAADRDRLRADRPRRIELGPHPRAG